MSEQHHHRCLITPVKEETPRPCWSVMIPTYNCANYLRETLASILAQDPGPEVMQIEVVDDHSTKDDPKAVVEEIGRGRVGFYQQPENVGHVKNFNTCIQRSRGKLIHLLHGDDCVRYGFYHKMQSVFDAHPQLGAAFCRHVFMDENGHWQCISELLQPESGILDNWLERIVIGQCIQTPSIVVQRNVYEKLGGFDNRFAYYYEDWEMWVRIATKYPVWYDVEPLAVYRLRSASNSGRTVRTGENMQEVRKGLDIVQSYLPAYMPKSTVSKLLKANRKCSAQHALRTASQMLVIGDIRTAIVQIREALKCSLSLEVIGWLVYFVSQGLARRVMIKVK
ncbi:glycosyltransferase family A protein [Brasilonema sp. UFV-L1]|uniref:glycosyltransferase family 2 protein n=1 Tax=Brasilonema sp. UFV-L1 TaxID=2234130 RepID=UPI00145EAC26|nr:glycosyltransferase family A protein [Brasilonema sp. UFV-L1]NMG11519.1 family 2 glycosyl transferase [Brasilonema sp. UFV-L1]